MHLSCLLLWDEHINSLGELVGFQAVAETDDQFQTLGEIDKIQILEDFLMLVIDNCESNKLQDHLI